mmetsp:Transcript_24143/g.59266  ORF Transcript_24143/g.59266 Transcript_24143/m.59266 type:complete len:431 (-) Transcript_24143:588-1880(-)
MERNPDLNLVPILRREHEGSHDDQDVRGQAPSPTVGKHRCHFLDVELCEEECLTHTGDRHGARRDAEPRLGVPLPVVQAVRPSNGGTKSKRHILANVGASVAHARARSRKLRIQIRGRIFRHRIFRRAGTYGGIFRTGTNRVLTQRLRLRLRQECGGEVAVVVDGEVNVAVGGDLVVAPPELSSVGREGNIHPPGHCGVVRVEHDRRPVRSMVHKGVAVRAALFPRDTHPTVHAIVHHGLVALLVDLGDVEPVAGAHGHVARARVRGEVHLKAVTVLKRALVSGGEYVHVRRRHGGRAVARLEDGVHSELADLRLEVPDLVEISKVPLMRRLDILVSDVWFLGALHARPVEVVTVHIVRAAAGGGGGGGGVGGSRARSVGGRVRENPRRRRSLLGPKDVLRPLGGLLPAGVHLPVHVLPDQVALGVVQTP